MLLLVEGSLAAHESAELRRHAGSCLRCARELQRLTALAQGLGEDVAGGSAARVAERVMERLDGQPGRAAPRRSRAWWALPVAAAAAAVLLVWAGTPRPDDYASRGGSGGDALRRWTGVQIYRLADPPMRLAEGAHVTGETAYVVSYRNAQVGRPAFLLLFALDAQGAVHWLFPAYQKVGEEPSSVVLTPSVERRVLGEAVVLENAAPGPMRFFGIVTRRPLRVSEIESLPREQLEAERLAARWPEANVEWLTVTVDPFGGNR
jgi:hypothetical protein